MKKQPQEVVPVVAPVLDIAGWREKIGDLTAGLSNAEALLVERRAARRLAAGQALLNGGEGEEDVIALMDLERETEDNVDALKAAVSIAEAEVATLEAQEAAKLEASRHAQREQLIAQIRNAAEAVRSRVCSSGRRP